MHEDVAPQRKAGLVLNAGSGRDPRGDVRLDFAQEVRPTVRGTVDALPFKQGAFGRILMQNVLEHTPNPGLLMREALRVLKPGGELWLRTDNAACLWYHVRLPLKFVEGHEYAGSEGDHHYMLFKAHHLRDLARNAGFADVRTSYVESGTTRGLARLLRRLRPELSAQHVLLEARRP
jgi:SAM-dependent methyltransferase